MITCEFDKFYLVSCLAPSVGTGKKMNRKTYKITEWDKDFASYIQDIEGRGKPAVICGDFNVSLDDIDIYDPEGFRRKAGFTQEERDSFKSFLDTGYIDVFRHLHPRTQKFTYWPTKNQAKENNHGQRLDYFITSKSLIDQVVSIDTYPDIEGSDHCPIAMSLNLKDLRV